MVTEEFTIHHDLPDESNFVLFRFVNGRVYRPNLHVFDDDGTELAFRPDSFVKSFLEKKEDGWAKELLEGIKTKSQSALLVSLPANRPLSPHETRVLRATYTDTTDIDTSWWTLLNVPKFKIGLHPPNDEPFRTQIVVLPPPDYEVYKRDEDVKGKKAGESAKYQLSDQHGYHATYTNHILDFSLPTRDREVDFKCNYIILPGREERWLFRLYFAAVAVVTAGLLATFGPFEWLNSAGQGWAGVLNGWLEGEFDVVAQSMLVLAVGFLGLVTNPLTHRTKLWLLVLIVLLVGMLGARASGTLSVNP